MPSTWSPAISSMKRPNSAEAWYRTGKPMSCGIDFCIQVRNVLRPNDVQSYGTGPNYYYPVGFKQFIAGKVVVCRADKSGRSLANHEVDLAKHAGGKTTDLSLADPRRRLIEDVPRPKRLSEIKANYSLFGSGFYGAWPIAASTPEEAASGYFDKYKNEYKFYDAPGWGNAYVDSNDPNDRSAVITGCEFEIEISHYLIRGDDVNMALWKGRFHLQGHRRGPSRRVRGEPDEKMEFQWYEDKLLDGGWYSER